jgi:hypothetical protein
VAYPKSNATSRRPRPFLDALQAFGGVAEDAKAVAGVGGVVLAVCETKIELPDLFNPAV